MARVELNIGQFEEIQKHIDKAKEYAIEAKDNIWGTNFDNLYNNFITNGFINDLYEDSESNYRKIFGGGTAVLCGAGAGIAGTAAAGVGVGASVAAVCSCIPVAGWIVAAVILAILAIVGIVYVISDVAGVAFSYEARDIFVELLTSCANGTHACYLAHEDIVTKLENARLNLQTILFKIDEFQKDCAKLDEAAESLGIKPQFASDGLTLTGVLTTVTIDGKEVETTVSDAMNAYFTYNETVMAAELEASILAEKYGVNINYDDIINRANGFMSSSIKAGLYSHEFVDVLQFQHSPSNGAVQAAAGELGITTDKFESVLNSLGLGIGAALIGASYVGKVGNGNGGNGNGGGGNGGGGNGGGGNGGGGTMPLPPVWPDNGDDKKKDDEDDDKEDDDKDKEEHNDVEIPEIEGDEEKDLEPVDDGTEKDYDELAREEYLKEMYQETNGVPDAINRHEELINEVNQMFDNQNVDGLKAKLKEFGYKDSDIESIITDRSFLLEAVIEGAERKELAARAQKLAEADGVKDWDTEFDDDYGMKDLDGNPDQFTERLSLDKDVAAAKEKVTKADAAYDKALEETNKSIKDLNAEKKELKALKDKFTEKYGSDTSKWSEDAANQYKEAVEKYNKNYKSTQEKISKLDTLKKDQETAVKEYDAAKDKCIENLHKINKENAAKAQEQAANTPVVEAPVATTDLPESNPVTVSDESVLAAIGNVDGTAQMGGTQ